MIHDLFSLFFPLLEIPSIFFSFFFFFFFLFLPPRLCMHAKSSYNYFLRTHIACSITYSPFPSAWCTLQQFRSTMFFFSLFFLFISKERDGLPKA
jgi:hypothetical protein